MFYDTKTYGHGSQSVQALNGIDLMVGDIAQELTVGRAWLATIGADVVVGDAAVVGAIDRVILPVGFAGLARVRARLDVGPGEGHEKHGVVDEIRPKAARLAVGAAKGAQVVLPALLEQLVDVPPELGVRPGDRVVWQFNYGKDLPKPYFFPVCLPDGTELTALGPSDHRWHYALWFSWKELNHANYWDRSDKTKLAGATDVLTARAEPKRDAGGVRLAGVTFVVPHCHCRAWPIRPNHPSPSLQTNPRT